MTSKRVLATFIKSTCLALPANMIALMCSDDRPEWIYLAITVICFIIVWALESSTGKERMKENRKLLSSPDIRIEFYGEHFAIVIGNDEFDPDYLTLFKDDKQYWILRKQIRDTKPESNERREYARQVKRHIQNVWIYGNSLICGNDVPDSSENKADKVIKTAQKEILDGNIQTSMQIIRRALEDGTGPGGIGSNEYKLAMIYVNAVKADESIDAAAKYKLMKKAFERAISMALSEKVNISVLAETYHKYGDIARQMNDFTTAEENYSIVVGIYRKLEESDSDAYNPNLAASLIDLANLHSETGKYEDAEKEHLEALKIRRELAGKTPDAYNPYLATSLNNLAVLHSETGKYEDAEKEHLEALKIRRELAGKAPDAYNPDLADSLNNLAVLHKNTSKYEDAEKEHLETLKIRRELAGKAPDAYNPALAASLNNLANLHNDTGKYGDAEKEHLEALKIRRELAGKAPDAYNPYLACSLNNLANLHRDTGKYEDAEKEYLEALKILRELARKAPDAYNPDLADSLSNQSLLYRTMKFYQKALDSASEAEKIYQSIYWQDHIKYSKRISGLHGLISELHTLIGNPLSDSTEIFPV